MKVKTKFIGKLIQILSNLQLSIFMLLIIAAISIIGTIIEQNQPVEFYQKNYPAQSNFMYPLSWTLIKSIGLDHIFQTWWFVSLLVFFTSTIICCTLSRQLPILKIAKHVKIYESLHSLQSKAIYKDNKNSTLSNYVANLALSRYTSFQSQNQVYACRGIVGRLSPIVVHLSMLFILFGSSIGFFNGFVSQEMVPQGEFFHIQNLTGSGLFSRVPQSLLYQVDTFRIDYNQDDSISQFYSKINLYDSSNNLIRSETISVNKPLKYNNIVIYQTDWKINGLRLNVNNEKIQILAKQILTNSNQKNWICVIPNIGPNQSAINLILNTLNNKIFIYDAAGQLLKIVEINENFAVNNHNIEVLEILTSSGLQIKVDPGIMFVYVGFIALMISSIISYVSLDEVWLTKKAQLISLTGKTNRSVLEFENHFTKLIKQSITNKLQARI
uniref:ResB-like domain-containing protein n=1 Tax=Erythrolobus madagascarensis TaxID=708628 RepID=A0A7S0T5K4_9RHOD|mmetsp:Transcript_3306/g.7163  ORF Transcript_3306/g.7163 Transcript_3306/m.7163 type:complete len:441 (+) Transcript_3306:21-1343(+)